MKYDRVIDFLACLFAACALLEMAVAIPYAALNFDGGTYMGTAWAIHSGLAVYRDFPLSYPPGVPLILASLGDRACQPSSVYALVFTLYLLTCALLYRILRHLEVSPSMSRYLTALHLTWVLFLDGIGIVLEPFQVVFLLLGLWALLRSQGSPKGAGLAGVAVGASVMMKQYSVLFVPPFLAFSLVRQDKVGRAALAFLLGLGVPFGMFVLFSQQSFLTLFLHLATFGGSSGGGQGIGHYYQDGLNPLYGPWTPVVMLWQRLWMPQFGLGPYLVAGIAVAALRRSALHTFLLSCFLAGLVPLCLRGFYHYPQLSAVWGILLVGRGWVAFASDRPVRQLLLSLGLFLLMLPDFIFNLRMALASCDYPPAQQQLRLAQVIRETVPQDDNVWMEALDNFYPLARKLPTERNFEGSRGRSMEKILALSDYVLWFHHAYTPASDIDGTDARLKAAGLERYAWADYDDGRFRMGRVLFYRKIKPQDRPEGATKQGG